MRVVAWLLVFFSSFVVGGWSIPLGFSFGLGSLEVYLLACLGSFVGMTVLVLASGWLRRHVDLPTPDPTSRVALMARRYGAPGLGIVGPIFPGVTVAMLLGLALDLDRRSLVAWMSVGVAVMFAIYVVVLTLLIDVVGVG
jgi:uncharacterized membrane protein